MKKIVLLAFALALLGASCNKKTDPANDVKDYGLSTYLHEGYGFIVEFGKAYEPVESPAYGSLEKKVVQVQSKDNPQPGTNLVDLAFSVSAQPGTTGQDCVGPTQIDGQDVPFTDTQNVNGTTFVAGKTTGAAAGNRYDSRVFRAANNGTCFELMQTVHTGNIGNYPAGEVEEADMAKAWDELDKILYTFRFTK